MVGNKKLNLSESNYGIIEFLLQFIKCLLIFHVNCNFFLTHFNKDYYKLIFKVNLPLITLRVTVTLGLFDGLQV